MYQFAVQHLETGEYLHGDTAASKPMANSPLGADVIAGILYDRYVLAMTGPKVAQEALTAGLGITRQTAYRVCTQFAVALALPLVRHLLWHIVRSKCAQSDETWVRVRQELAERGRRNSVMWLVRTGEKLGIPPAVVLAHTGTRSADALADLLRDFSGKLMCDGYTAYPAALELLAEAVREADGEQAERLIVLCGCLQHVRAMNWWDSRVTNAILEGTNSLIQSIKRASRGFRNADYFTGTIFLRHGKLEFEAHQG